MCDTKNEKIWLIIFTDTFSSFLAIKSFYSFRKEKNSDINVTKKAYSFNTRYRKVDYDDLLLLLTEIYPSAQALVEIQGTNKKKNQCKMILSSIEKE